MSKKQIALFALPLAAAVLAAARAVTIEQEIKFTVPDGFAVETVYPAAKAGSVVALNFDAQGRLVLARENGPVVTLLDTNGDGTVDEERPFTDQVTTSQGLFFDGPDLLVVGRNADGVVGLFRVTDADGDSRGERVELIERAIGNIQEHGPHAVYFGPDGYLYWTQGNGTGILKRFAPLSPLREYDEASVFGRVDPRGHAMQWRAPGGAFLRKRIQTVGTGGAASAPEAADWELFAAGFRNQYDGAFNLIGELFTFDSDMEWDRDLPWYKPTSSVHVLAGGDHGWRSGSMNLPWYYLDVLSPMEETGRGSPTGVTFYQAYNYPAEYQDAFLQADWSRGRIVAGRLTRSGSTYRQTSSNFVYGEPLNVTDLEVGPDGNVYFALGGRNTQGGIYRVVYRGQAAMPRPQATTPMDRVLTMPQPRSAWSRELARRTRAELGERRWQRALVAEIRNARSTPERRVRAMELLQAFGPGPEEALLATLRADPSWEVRAASTYYLGMRGTQTARAELVTRLRDPDAFVQRRAAEALIRTGINPTAEPPFSPVRDVMPLLSSSDRFVRYQARALLRATNPNLWQEAALGVEGYPQAAEALMAVAQTLEDPRITDVTRLLARELELLRANPSDAELLQLIRVIQRTLLEAHGVTNHAVGQFAAQPAPGTRGPSQPNAFTAIGELLLARFPSADWAVSRELARTLAFMETPGAVARIAAELDNPRNNREQQVFYADQLSYMKRGWDQGPMDRMTGWLERVYREDWRGGASFTGFINYIRDAFLEAIPAERFAAVSQRIQAAQPRLAAMPGAGPQRAQATISDEELFEELVYNPNIRQGNVAGGAAAYQKSGCIACHTFGPIGREFGPDLTTIAQRFSRRDLVRAVTHPSETVSDLWQVEEITRANGQKVSGTVYREDGNEVILQIPGTGQQIAIPRSDVRARVRSQTSPMPHGLLSNLSNQEQRDLFLLLEAGPAAIPDSALARLGARR